MGKMPERWVQHKISTPSAKRRRLNGMRDRLRRRNRVEAQVLRLGQGNVDWEDPMWEDVREGIMEVEILEGDAVPPEPPAPEQQQQVAAEVEVEGEVAAEGGGGGGAVAGNGGGDPSIQGDDCAAEVCGWFEKFVNRFCCWCN